MKVLDLGLNAIYRYRVEIPRENKTSIDDFRDWLSTTKITAAWVPGLVFFQNEKDVVLFIMRWS